MNKIFIIHENDEWVEPLRVNLYDLHVPFEEWHMDIVNINTSNPPPLGVFYNRMSASSHTRGHHYAPEYTAVVLNWLESNNRKIINNSRALCLELSKSLQYNELIKESNDTAKLISGPVEYRTDIGLYSLSYNDCPKKIPSIFNR